MPLFQLFPDVEAGRNGAMAPALWRVGIGKTPKHIRFYSLSPAARFATLTASPPTNRVRNDAPTAEGIRGSFSELDLQD